ncbi:hypothetical protein MTR_8g057697 [Medicago truncatula]|uniref:Uncharacterized protein n=1 Tax=Medicago truncatula TaxID=3880 RepID=A0A072TRE8_MEDTR|nr:hypothetical protein MTR_8g057697 [Medicago truncatula]
MMKLVISGFFEGGGGIASESDGLVLVGKSEEGFGEICSDWTQRGGWKFEVIGYLGLKDVVSAPTFIKNYNCDLTNASMKMLCSWAVIVTPSLNYWFYLTI